MLAFLADLEAQGRAVAIELPGTAEPRRWIGAEDAPLYASAFPRDSEIEPDGSPTPSPSDDGVATIVRRFLQSHALIGLDDLTARYPIGPARARELLELLADDGGLVRLVPAGDPDAARWADARNLDEVRRLSIALRRRESVAVLPEVFADFLARRHHLHPSTRLEGSAAVGLILERLQGFAAPAALWETELFPRRVRDYRPAWLDETISTGGWLWRAEAEAEARGEPRVAFVPRDFHGGWPAREEVAGALGGRGPGPRSPGTSRRLLRERPGAGARPGTVPDAAGTARRPAPGAGDQRSVRPDASGGPGGRRGPGRGLGPPAVASPDAGEVAPEALPRGLEPPRGAMVAPGPGRDGRRGRLPGLDRGDARSVWRPDPRDGRTRRLGPPLAGPGPLAGPRRAPGRAAPGLLRRGALGRAIRLGRGRRGAGPAGRRRRDRSRSRS